MKKQKEVALTVAKRNGEVIFRGIASLTSGTEITGVNLCRKLTPGEENRVTVTSAPLKGSRISK